MPKQPDYEILGTLITDGESVGLDLTGGDGIEGYDMGDEFVFALRGELSSHEHEGEWAKILVAKLTAIIAKRALTDAEEELAELEKKKMPEAKTKEEGL